MPCYVGRTQLSPQSRAHTTASSAFSNTGTIIDDTVAKEVSLVQIIKQPRRRIAYFLSIGLLVGFCWFVMVHIGAKMTIWNHVLFGVTTIPILIYSSLLMISPDVIQMDDS